MKGVFGTGNIDSRFHVLSNMFVIIGTPLFPVEGSRIYSAYRVLVYVVLCLTFVTVLIGISKNLDDMAYVMESARPGLAMFNVMWSHFFMRYKAIRLWVDSPGLFHTHAKKKNSAVSRYHYYMPRYVWLCKEVVTRNLYHESQHRWRQIS